MAVQIRSMTLAPAFLERLKGRLKRLGEIEVDALPLVGRLPAEKRTARLAQVLFVSFLLAVLCLGYYFSQVGKPSRNAEMAANLQTLSQRAAAMTERAMRGEAAAFVALRDAGQAFTENLEQLIANNPVGELRSDLDALKNRWQITRRNIDALMAQQQTVQAMAKGLNQLGARQGTFLDQAGEVLAQSPRDGAAATAVIYQLAFLAQRMSANTQALGGARTLESSAGQALTDDGRLLRRLLGGLLSGDAELGISPVGNAALREKLGAMRDTLGGTEEPLNALVKNLPQLREAKRAAAEIASESEQVYTAARKLGETYAPQGSRLSLYAALLFAAAALASLVLLGLVNVAASRRRAEGMALETRRNQDAILRLLNEMGELAEGNLTIRASVTEDITGAIADAVNFAIEELRSLVENVNRAAAEVTRATETAKQVSGEMLSSADRQSQEVAKTTEAVNHMSQSIARVSKHTAESARVAEQSLGSARRGGDAVRNAISGMDSIRDQIQDTSKRIKRLGESSQEIGEILELITDLTEQTNVLALNAAIQAAAAGEAGRGFTVVAEEVQRLAERSGQATRRIGAIVKTIQSDTQDAVHAMALTTQGVVQGTSLSDAAGVALSDIEKVSAQLAHLIQSISEATTDQARTAAQIANTMRRILAETRQTEASAQQSAQSIVELTALSEELKVSVAGFKL